MFKDVTPEDKQAGLDLATACVTALNDETDPYGMLHHMILLADDDASRNALLEAVLILAGLTNDLVAKAGIDRDAFTTGMARAYL